MVASTALAGGLLLASPGMAAAAQPEPGTPPKCEPGAKAGPTTVGMTGIDDADHQGMVELRAGDKDPALITPAEREPGQRFGEALAGKWMVEAADQNFLLVGAPGETVAGKENAGALYVFLNTAQGICQLDHLTQDDERVPGQATAGAEFGASVDGTHGYDDTYEHWLHVGAPGLADGEVAEAGGVISLGLDSRQNGKELVLGAKELTMLSTTGAEPTEGARFGSTVAEVSPGLWYAGAPGATVDGAEGAGLVAGQVDVFPSKYAVLRQGADDMPGAPEPGDGFGSALTTSAGDDPWSGRLWIGVPGEDVGDVADAGMVSSYRHKSGTGAAGPSYTQNTPDDGTGEPVPGTAEEGDRLGAALGTVPANKQAWDTSGILAGTPGEDALGKKDIGTVTGLHGAPSFSQADVGGELGEGNEFGSAVGRLGVGAPGTPGEGARGAKGAAAFANVNDGDLGWTHRTPLGDLDEGAVYGSAVEVSEMH